MAVLLHAALLHAALYVLRTPLLSAVLWRAGLCRVLCCLGVLLCAGWSGVRGVSLFSAYDKSR